MTSLTLVESLLEIGTQEHRITAVLCDQLQGNSLQAQMELQ